MAGRRVGVWVGWLVAGLLAVGGGVWVLVTRLTAEQLSAADQVASVVAAVVALAGFPVAVYGLVLARRGTPGEGGPAGGGGVRQDVRARRDAYVAGRDQHFGRGPDRR